MADKDKRRKDIEAKKRKLAEIRKRRKQRSEQRGRGVADRMAPPSQRGKEFMDDVINMVQAMSTSKRSLSAERKEDTLKASPIEAAAGPAYIGNLEVQKKVGALNIQGEEKATYTKKIQVDVAELATEIGIIKYTSSEAHITAVKAAFAMPELTVWPPKNKVVEEVVETKVEEDKKEELAPEELEEDALPEIMDQKEALAIIRSEEFQDFWVRSSLIMERACAQNEDQNIYIDYGAADNVVAGEQQTTNLLDFKNRYRQEDTTVGRPITSLAFSKVRKELFLASYAEPLQPLSDIPDGTVHIWSKLLTEKPEKTFQSQSMVTVADFHPSNAKLIVGATVAGAIVVWDMRAKKKTPQNRTPFHTSHQRAVYAMQLHPTHQKVMHIRSVCNGGSLMIWRDEMMESPNSKYTLKPKNEGVGNMRGGEELLTTCFSAYPRNPHQLVFGSTDGFIYKGSIFQKMASSQRDIEVTPIKAHHGPITSMEFHPGGNRVPKTISDTFLTSSFDWTVKLWNYRTEQEIHCFEHMQDYVHDCKWSPVHPAVFACCDGLGNIHIYNLSKDWTKPVVVNVEEQSKFALCRLSWSLDGKQLLVGDANGDLLLYDVNQSLYEVNDSDITEFNRYLKHKLN